jgi:hypothetical protein
VSLCNGVDVVDIKQPDTDPLSRALESSVWARRFDARCRSPRPAASRGELRHVTCSPSGVARPHCQLGLWLETLALPQCVRGAGLPEVAFLSGGWSSGWRRS